MVFSVHKFPFQTQVPLIIQNFTNYDIKIFILFKFNTVCLTDHPCFMCIMSLKKYVIEGRIRGAAEGRGK